jgi:ubiquitin-activating enzyme E1
MCTVHSFPHNIDHCLTWARSEFEGLLEKGPSEANAYLADPAKYSGERSSNCLQGRAMRTASSASLHISSAAVFYVL